MIIHEHYGRVVPIPYNSKHGESPVVLPDWMVGLELEIENWNPDVTRTFGGFTFTDDGSLRASDDGIGIEAISRPVQAKHVEKLLAAFFRKFDIKEGNYTERCSTHVHVNVDVLTYQQLSSVCLLYQTVESLLFNFVGGDRENNIFCVPWNQCSLSYRIVSKIENIERGDEIPFRRWQKYSALNLIPVHNQGTIEFRHMVGTCNVEKLMQWINLILCMVKYSIEHSLAEIKEDIINMNTISNYNEWLTRVFDKYAVLLCTDRFEEVLSRGVVDSKLMLTHEKEKFIKSKSVNLTGEVNELRRILDQMRDARIQPPPPRPPLRVQVDPGRQYGLHDEETINTIAPVYNAPTGARLTDGEGTR